jgi:hypothetical protein
MEQERYSEEAAREILKRAVELQGRETDFSREQLISMADELGIPRDSLVAAEQKWLREHEEDAELQAFEAHRRQAFRSHLAIYTLVNSFLFILNLITSPGQFWFIFPLLGWGLGLAIHAWAVQQREGDSYGQEFLQWRAQRGTRDRRRLRS